MKIREGEGETDIGIPSISVFFFFFESLVRVESCLSIKKKKESFDLSIRNGDLRVL